MAAHLCLDTEHPLQPLLGNSGPGNAATDGFQLLALVRLGGNCGMQADGCPLRVTWGNTLPRAFTLLASL